MRTAASRVDAAVDHILIESRVQAEGDEVPYSSVLPRLHLEKLWSIPEGA